MQSSIAGCVDESRCGTTVVKDRKKSQLTVSIAAAESGVSPFRLGPRVREIRKGRRWTLAEASERTGLARSTLSKIENEQMSPTFDAVRKLAAGLGIDIPQLFEPYASEQSPARRALTTNGEGRPHPTSTYEHELLCTELANKRMIPFKTVVRARAFADFSDWVRHSGEEFLLVLAGAIAFYSEYYEPVTLNVGDSIYYDSSMGHVCVSVSRDDAQILWVCAP
ncbi:MAG: XRE family transcriptional regulator [Gammaproteobacteria bacterium]|nr:XRE family transcriptional regulator [Gammaproteobacteria bacterium]